MEFLIGKSNPGIGLITGEDEWPGVVRIARKVSDDISLVTDTECPVISAGAGFEGIKSGQIYAATLGHSALADTLEKAGVFDAAAIRGRREVYSFALVSRKGIWTGAPEADTVIRAEDGDGCALVIIGSDKRGTIYGLFHISELLGVSPWVWFADVPPARRDNVSITADMNMISREPSVEYRGIFINDEWPSFGNWTFEHFGGFTAQMYEHVFELILRLKGNYLWPAMWTSNFSLDGPGFANAELADEMGIVMSNSHHEPCLRHSEEWDLVKGEDSPYGTEWNFDRNREGLTNYWRDGLKRNGHLENIVTMGMRGERDSEIMGAEATLKDNIDYIKEVVEVQNDLIRETIDPDPDNVPRMIAIYKEVEKYYYGDADTPGLKTWEGLDGITCMLCEDNHGNMRGLPTDEDRDRRGGFGMYYHFDYHGGPVSYEWINSTHLPKVWEQMCEAYEAGVRKIWIVNVGDLKPQELPISYFLDLAYDYDRWGISNTGSADEYLKKWTFEQFGGFRDESGASYTEEIAGLINGYTYLNLCRKPETLNAWVYHPFNYGEASYMMAMASVLYQKAMLLGEVFAGTEWDEAYRQLVTHPVCATSNLLYMQLCAGRNIHLARSARPTANIYAHLVDECMLRDGMLTDMYHQISDGKWNHMMSSEHIGFTAWNDEEAMYPAVGRVFSFRQPRMCVSLSDADKSSCGGDWTRKPLYITDFIDPTVEYAGITIENTGRGKLEWKAECESPWVVLSENSGILEPFPAFPPDDMAEEVLPCYPMDRICSITDLSISVRRDAIETYTDGIAQAVIRIDSGFSHVDVIIPVVDPECYAGARDRNGAFAGSRIIPVIPQSYLDVNRAPELVCNGTGLCIGADEYDEAREADGGRFVTLPNYGKYRTAVKAYPVTEHFAVSDGMSANEAMRTAPSLSYNVYAYEPGDYEITIVTAPSNPIDGSGQLRIGIGTGDTPVRLLSMVDPGYMGGENSCGEWCRSVLDQEHKKTVTVPLNEGENVITVYAADPGVVLERILIRKSGTEWMPGYMGKFWRD